MPQIAERMLPFCVLIGAMSCYLDLSRRLELVVSRAAGMSAWQFIAPAVVMALLVGVVATTVYNPVAAVLHERSKRLEAELSGNVAERPASDRERLLGDASAATTASRSSTPRAAASRACC